MVHVDFVTQERTCEGNARLYAQIIASNGAMLAADG